ncbi:MAG TPA: glucose-1-phosphate adenylyltransferase [Gemmataceae bacterium]|jgi:glucose-1-phosphate adenylyltransferase|nr:glucose-1-phosphate adenylyltransferase [Gemmataceae bacterium]
MQSVLGLILGGGRGAHLFPLTKHRSVPAVPIAGKYRLIDIPISNCINSGINRIYVLTQYLSVSLHKHIAHTYKFDPFNRGFVEILAAQQTNETAGWYQGTADAVRQNLRYLQEDSAREFLVLSGDQLYRMDFRHLLGTHRDRQADVTIAVLPVTAERARDLGVVRVDGSLRIVGLVEKPATAEQLQPFRLPAGWLESQGIVSQGREYLANMGIYLFSRQVLFNLLQARPAAADFVREVFAESLATCRIQAYLFDDYWEDLGTVRAYHEANLALTGDQPPFDFHSPEGVIYTRMRHLPASRVSDAVAEQCLISDGCVIEAGAKLQRCIVGLRSRIGRNVTLRDTVMNGADRFETDAERAANRQRGVPDFGVGEGSVIERAILDKDCRIGRGVQIINRHRLQQADGPNYHIRDGIVVIPNSAVVPDGTVI